MQDENDVIRIRIHKAIEQIESLYNKVLGKKYHKNPSSEKE
jgi:hypothetical protein